MRQQFDEVQHMPSNAYLSPLLYDFYQACNASPPQGARIVAVTTYKINMNVVGSRLLTST